MPKDPLFPDRPDHPDFWRMSEVAIRLNHECDVEGEEAFTRQVSNIADLDSVAYMAEQRALRVASLMHLTAAGAGMPRMPPGAEALMMKWLIASWMDGAIMMAHYERERSKQDPESRG